MSDIESPTNYGERIARLEKQVATLIARVEILEATRPVVVINGPIIAPGPVACEPIG